MIVQMNVKQLRALAEHSKRVGTQDAMIDLLIEALEKMGKTISESQPSDLTEQVRLLTERINDLENRLVYKSGFHLYSVPGGLNDAEPLKFGDDPTLPGFTSNDSEPQTLGQAATAGATYNTCDCSANHR